MPQRREGAYIFSKIMIDLLGLIGFGVPALVFGDEDQSVVGIGMV